MTQRPSPPEALALWGSVDGYFEGRLAPPDPSLEAALAASRSAGLPDIQVSPLQGRLLHLLARAIGARRILEIGTLGGYSTIWLARALPAGGRLLTLELEPRHAEVARANLRAAGVEERVEIRVGDAHRSLVALPREGDPPFDLVFIDAEKTGYPEYLEHALRLARPGALVIADNVVRRGDVADPDSPDPQVQAVRRTVDRLAGDARVFATVVQTVGVKGHDGMLVLQLLSAGGPPGRSAPPA